MLPIRTSIYPKKTPYANYILIAVNILLFMLSYGPHQIYDPSIGKLLEPLRSWAQPFLLYPDRPEIWQFLTYAFLHANLWHILGNMYFLYLFGNNVNDKLGNIGYLCFYLAGAVFSGIGSCLLSHNPILGASGAIAAVTGAYLVLFPNTLITVVYWFIFIGTIEIRALFFIAFKLIVWDNIIAADPGQGIAYNAHLAGYGFGIFAILGLLAVGLVEKDFNDLWSMIRQWNRRRKFRDVVSAGYDPYAGGSRKKIDATIQNAKPSEKENAILDLRSRISQAVTNRASGEAARLYLELIAIDDTQVMPRQLQLDIANQLMADGKWSESAVAYEKFLSQYQSYEFGEQVHLMLGLLYARYLNRPEEALQQLKLAEARLTDAGQKDLCKQEIKRLENS